MVVFFHSGFLYPAFCEIKQYPLTYFIAFTQEVFIRHPSSRQLAISPSSLASSSGFYPGGHFSVICYGGFHRGACLGHNNSTHNSYFVSSLFFPVVPCSILSAFRIVMRFTFISSISGSVSRHTLITAPAPACIHSPPRHFSASQRQI